MIAAWLAVFASGGIFGFLTAALMAYWRVREMQEHSVCCECHDHQARFCAHCTSDAIYNATHSEKRSRTCG